MGQTASQAGKGDHPAGACPCALETWERRLPVRLPPCPLTSSAHTPPSGPVAGTALQGWRVSLPLLPLWTKASGPGCQSLLLASQTWAGSVLSLPGLISTLVSPPEMRPSQEPLRGPQPHAHPDPLSPVTQQPDRPVSTPQGPSCWFLQPLPRLPRGLDTTPSFFGCSSPPLLEVPVHLAPPPTLSRGPREKPPTGPLVSSPLFLPWVCRRVHRARRSSWRRRSSRRRRRWRCNRCRWRQIHRRKVQPPPEENDR